MSSCSSASSSTSSYGNSVYDVTSSVQALSLESKAPQDEDLKMEFLDLRNSPNLNYSLKYVVDHFPNLKSLVLPKDISDDDIAILQGLKSLKILDVSHTNIKGTHFSFLPASLEELSCMGCKNLLDPAIMDLKDKKNLRILNISGTRIIGVFFAYLPKSLKTLNCDECENITKTSRAYKYLEKIQGKESCQKPEEKKQG